MKILITGCSGFVGKAVLKRISSNSSDNQIFLLSSKENHLYYTYIYKKTDEKYYWIIPDDFDIIVHIGAWTPKSTSEAQNIDKGFDNILFTKTLLQSQKHLKRIVFISTLDVYAATSEIIRESSIVKPISIYGYSKLYCEEMVSSWAKQNNIECCILRLGHIYGVGEAEYKKLIPILIRQGLTDSAINIFSSGNELRSFLNIDDCADIIWQATIGHMQGLYNVVSGHSVSVKEIAQTIKRLTESNSEVIIQNQPIETRDCVFDNSHLKSAFKIQEKPLEEGIKEEIEYFKGLSE
ncbi:MAG: NAD(P)-dependent oxidoreductase [Bacteroidales bacterium]|nr:NAD(P)-dependent oxidoreductase [Bacteroidales bacterium]